MKKLFRMPLYAVFAIALTFSTTSCNDSDNDESIDEEKEELLSQAIPQYVNNTVVATYKSLADETIVLYDALVVLKGNKSTTNVKAAVDAWIKARDYWEKSEAFLYGAASDFGIDPHIDTWPLAIDELQTVLKNETQINSMNSENGDSWAGEFLGNGLLGFHAIEYILFENGSAKSYDKITDKDLIYAVAVAGDLRNQCFRLEASWAGIDNVSDVKKAKLEDLEMVVTMNNRNSYGTNMLNAGKAGSTYITTVDACEAIIEGCITISDEVGTMKIGKPHTNEDVNYIESPYSDNSKVDFIGNIESIRNAYLGGANASKRGASVSDYIKKINPTLDTQVKNAIDNTIAKINAIPDPFVETYASSQAGEAMDACDELTKILQKVKSALNE